MYCCSGLTVHYHLLLKGKSHISYLIFILYKVPTEEDWLGGERSFLRLYLCAISPLSGQPSLIFLPFLYK